MILPLMKALPHAVLAAIACVTLCRVEVANSNADPAAELRDRYAALNEQLEKSPLQKGLHLESVESSGTLQGDIYAVIDYPVAQVRDTFTTPGDWCEALLLHLNIKNCQVGMEGESTTLSVAIGRKFEEPLSDAYRVEFAYAVDATASGYTEITLDADQGPLGTRDYHISLEFIGIEKEQTFLHVRYSYRYGSMAQLAMSAYLATIGEGKVGFTKVAGENGKSRSLSVACAA